MFHILQKFNYFNDFQIILGHFKPNYKVFIIYTLKSQTFPLKLLGWIFRGWVMPKVITCRKRKVKFYYIFILHCDYYKMFSD